MHYVIGDIHGCYQDMMALLNKIESQDQDAQIIFVGDFIDRGPDVDKVLDWSLENITLDGKYRAVRGNHEQMVLEWYKEFMDWYDNAGNYSAREPMPETYYDFSRWMDAMGKLSPAGLKPYIDFFSHLPYNRKMTVETASGKTVDYRIVHAFYEYDEGVPKLEQYYTNLYARKYGNYKSEEIVVHGHTPTIALAAEDSLTYNIRPGLISYHKSDVNVDCGCVYKEAYPEYPVMLGAFCLETFEEIYSKSVKERFLENGAEDGVRKYEDYKEQCLARESLERAVLMKMYL